MPEGTVTEEPLISQTFRYCCDVYRIMDAEAQDHTLDDPNGVTMRVWEGFFTKLIKDRMGLSVPYYSSVRGNLLRMGCIRQLRRGGGSSPSQYELIQEPTEDLWHNAPVRRHHMSTKHDNTQGQLAEIQRRLVRVEENISVLAKAFADTGGQVPFDEPKKLKEYEVVTE